MLTELAGRDIRWFLQTARTGFSRGVDPPIQIRPPCIRQPSMLDGAAIAASAGPFSFRGGAQHARGVSPADCVDCNIIALIFGKGRYLPILTGA